MPLDYPTADCAQARIGMVYAMISMLLSRELQSPFLSTIDQSVDTFETLQLQMFQSTSFSAPTPLPCRPCLPSW